MSSRFDEVSMSEGLPLLGATNGARLAGDRTRRRRAPSRGSLLRCWRREARQGAPSVDRAPAAAPPLEALLGPAGRGTDRPGGPARRKPDVFSVVRHAAHVLGKR